MSYCHTPMRYAWDWRLESGRLPRWARPCLPAVAAVFRRLDRRWSRRVDTFVANSTFVRRRIQRSYQVDAVVVPPPVDIEWFTPAPGSARTDGPFVAAGRFVPYKRLDLAIEAANRSSAPLVVAGDGPDRERLAALAGPTVSLVVAPTDDDLRSLLRSARAFVFPGVEDFGMLPVEAQACGTPVIARRAGGALDSVVPGVTGELIDDEDPEAWGAALDRFDRDRYRPELIRDHATGFSTDRFRARFVAAAELAEISPNTEDTV